jgi:hypothetical protein
LIAETKNSTSSASKIAMMIRPQSRRFPSETGKRLTQEAGYAVGGGAFMHQ